MRVAISRLRLSAARRWPKTSCNSREMRRRSAVRLLSARTSRVASSSALSRPSSSRARSSRASSDEVKKARSWNGRYAANRLKA